MFVELYPDYVVSLRFAGDNFEGCIEGEDPYIRPAGGATLWKKVVRLTLPCGITISDWMVKSIIEDKFKKGEVL